MPVWDGIFVKRKKKLLTEFVNEGFFGWFWQIIQLGWEMPESSLDPSLAGSAGRQGTMSVFLANILTPAVVTDTRLGREIFFFYPELTYLGLLHRSRMIHDNFTNHTGVRTTFHWNKENGIKDSSKMLTFRNEVNLGNDIQLKYIECQHILHSF